MRTKKPFPRLWRRLFVWRYQVAYAIDHALVSAGMSIAVRVLERQLKLAMRQLGDV